MTRFSRGVIVGAAIVLAAVAAPRRRARAAEASVAESPSPPPAPAPTAADVGGTPTAVLASPGTVTVRTALGTSVERIEGHATVPSGGLAVAFVAAPRLEVSLAVTAIPLDAAYGPIDARLGARVALRKEGALRISALTGLHLGIPPIIDDRTAYGADAGMAVTHCRDQACRANATLFGSIDYHRVADGMFNESPYAFYRAQAAVGASVAQPFNAWSGLFVSGRASTTFACSEATAGGDPCMAGPARLLTATTGARFASRDGRQAFDLGVSFVRGALAPFNARDQSNLFVGGVFTTAWSR